MKKINKIVFLCLILLMFYGLLFSQTISTTKHNMSSDGTNTIRASTESEICIFCHTPHNSKPRAPLWNRNDPGTTYQLYTSSTTNASIGNPDGASQMCLSCHDGSIALGSVASRTSEISFGSNRFIPSGSTNLGSDLRDDHPISFVYNTALATANTQIKSPSNITSPVHLDNNNKLQCTSCHDPHQNDYNKFLIQTNQNSSLCLACHQNTNWTNSTHKTSTRTWNGSSTNPWQHTSYSTVATNACESCHNPHTAGGPKRLLNYSAEENNCLYCHNGNVAQTNVSTQFNKTYRHNIANYTGTHDPTEGNVPTTQHVECVDCHNPHQSNATSATAPNVKGYNIGVKGVNSSGNNVSSVSYAYEICYRCHTTNSWRPGSPTTRQIAQNNVRLEFSTANPSYHPIQGAGVNTDVPSLINGWSTTSVMYCTDCHSSDGATSPKGPHGSTYNHELKKQNTTSDPTGNYSNTYYALCFECHRESGTNSVLGNQNGTTFTRHYLHVVEERTPCNTCHDPHGISSTQGNSTNNSKLINFNTNVVTSYNNQLRYVRTGYRSGYCELRCHGENHNRYSYP